MADDKTILIKGGLCVSQGKSRQADVLVADGRIRRIADSIEATPAMEVIPAKGCIVSYGLCDVHVHLREPGYEYKETIATGSRAAAHGGFSTVCAMPNLKPAPDSPEALQVELDAIHRDAVIDVRPYATITRGRKGTEVVDVEALRDKVCGFSDDGSGIQRAEVMRQAMIRVKEAGSLIAAHCEDNSLIHGGYIHDGRYAREHGHRGICSESEWGQIARDVKLAAETGCHYHVCHISTKESVDIIRKAQQAGVHVTCETGPHYLALCEDDLREEGRYKMNPPLRSREDQAALIRGIQDGTITCIATDHAPHSAEEKARGLEHSAMGIVGLETSFAVAYTTLVERGLISIEQLIQLMCDRPRETFGLGGSLHEGESADLTLMDITTPYHIDSHTFLSKGKATPFDGMEVKGRCLLTLFRGRKVWSSAPQN